MGTTKKTEAQKAALVRDWIEERHRLGTTQVEFASRHGIGERTLRAYVATHAPRSAPVHQLREILAETLGALQWLGARLDELDGLPAAGPAVAPVNTEPAVATAAVQRPAGKEIGVTGTSLQPTYSFWD